METLHGIGCCAFIVPLIAFNSSLEAIYQYVVIYVMGPLLFETFLIFKLILNDALLN